MGLGILPIPGGVNHRPEITDPKSPTSRNAISHFASCPGGGGEGGGPKRRSSLSFIFRRAAVSIKHSRQVRLQMGSVSPPPGRYRPGGWGRGVV